MQNTANTFSVLEDYLAELIAEGIDNGQGGEVCDSLFSTGMSGREFTELERRGRFLRGVSA